jgi:hypothetical protein
MSTSESDMKCRLGEYDTRSLVTSAMDTQCGLQQGAAVVVRMRGHPGSWIIN